MTSAGVTAKWTSTYSGGGGDDKRRFSRPCLGFPVGSVAFACGLNCMDARRRSSNSVPNAGSSLGLTFWRGEASWAAGEPLCGALDVGEVLILLCGRL